MDIEMLRVQMVTETEKKWESKKRVLQNTFKRKREDVLNEYIMKSTEEEHRLADRFQGEIKRVKTGLSHALKMMLEREMNGFIDVLTKDYLAYLLSEKGTSEVLKAARSQASGLKSPSVLLGHLHGKKEFETGDFSYGFRILAADGSLEIDCSDIFLKEEVRKTAMKIIHSEILKEYEDL